MRLRRPRCKPDYHRIAELERELDLPPTVIEDDLKWGPDAAADTVLKSLYTSPIRQQFVQCSQKRVWERPQYDDDWLTQAIEQDRDEIARRANAIPA